MAHDIHSYRVQYWGKQREDKATSHAVRRFADHTNALLAYIRSIQDAAMGMIDISRIRLEKSTEIGWVIIYECEINFKGEVTQNDRMPRRDYLIKRWRQENPEGSKTECAEATGLDKKAVKKWWD